MKCCFRMQWKVDRIFCDILLESDKICGMMKYLISFDLGGHADETHSL